MGKVETLELLMRGAAIGAFVGLAIIMLRDQRSPARLTGALFCVAAAAHTLTQMPGIHDALGWTWGPVWAFSVMGAGFFWAFAVELFEDETRLDLRRFAPAAVLLLIGFGTALMDGFAQRALLFIHNLASAALIAHALWVISSGWRSDLVETRRRLRGPILAVAACYALTIVTVQTGEIFVGSAAALSPIAALSLMLLSLLGLASFGRVDESLFGPAVAQSAAGAATATPPPIVKENALAAEALDRLMRTDRIYREEGLTVSALAGRLNMPEHQLRRLINQQLGHRNFSAYLNGWRLGDAKQALADPAQRDVPISTIALDAGFQSLGPFNRAFKADTGLTPMEFRAQALAAVNKPLTGGKPATS